ncbi:cell wall protein RBR3-like [Hibiscus syriacus]|uniref:cell wall protein RBR3-like n=1 Tax=Hibiscus syriacus TaxID=106335 RepID=UPI0019211CD9|nr:cell wall protein RBR3-like [Hibiscus syriacus]
MPPSPALRHSPGRELRGGTHKRWCSLEGVLNVHEKDDDLALFNEMQFKERDNFLLQPSDDMEDSFSTKLKYFSDFKLGVSVPVRGETSELLDADEEKNDYEWLLTPPDTPLFPSLDDEPPPSNIVRRGRPRTQPISISRSSTMDKSYRSSRGSASPNRLSPSPRSTTSTLQSRGRPSSAPQSSPIRQSTPTRRPSPSPSKSSTPGQRSSTPTQRTSTGGRGTSPIRTSRVNSTSPKIRAWQSNIPGFSLDAPPNLRTSLGDRPASYVRGSSPASRNGRDARFGRKSMSPTASRSVSSSHSYDRDQLSSYSRVSVASSGDYDADPLQSIPLSGSTLSVPRRLGTYKNNMGPTFNKKSARVLSPSSAPKRSFDSALRQMDHRKSPPNMFRPLLSSVPSTTFYVGKGSFTHSSLMSKNSSVTTSSNANCDQSSSAVLDIEGSDQYDDMASESGRVPYANVLEEVFAFDKMDAVNQDASYETHNDSLNILIEDIDRDSTIQCDPDHSGELCHHGLEVEMTSNSDPLRDRGDLFETDSFENTKICSKCGCRYLVIERVEEETSLCTDCSRQHGIVGGDISDAENYPELFMEVSEEDKPYPEVEISINPSDSLLHVADAHYSDEHLKVNSSEVVGISVLLKRSGSSKGPVVLGRTFSTIPSEDLSYARDSSNSFRSSVGHGSVSVSSSVELSSSRQTNTLNAIKSELENYRYDLNAKPPSFTLSQSSSNNYQALSLASSTNDENFESSVRSLKFEEAEDLAVVSLAKASQNSEADSSFPAAAISKTDGIEWNESSNVIDTLTSEPLEDNSAASFPLNNDSVSYENVNSFSTNARIAPSVEALPTTLDPTLEEHGMQNDIPDAVEAAGHTFLTTISEIEIDNSCRSSCSSELDGLSPNSERKKKRSMDLSDAIPFYVDITASVEEHDTSDHAVGVLEESTVLVECRGGSKARSLTLEEATGTILFCSSIIHDLAYEAASIAIERESSVQLEGSRPTVTILGKSTSDRKDLRGRTVGRWTSKSNKVRQRRVETDVKSVPTKTVNDENAYEPSNHNVDIPNKMDNMNPPKLESKCNCSIM